MNPEHATVTVKKVATKEDWLKFRSICTLAGTDATKVIQRFVGRVVDSGELEQDIFLDIFTKEKISDIKRMINNKSEYMVYGDGCVPYSGDYIKIDESCFYGKNAVPLKPTGTIKYK